MSVQINLFPSEDTLIVCKKPDGTNIELDVLELEEMSHSLFQSPEDHIPYVEYIKQMCSVFKTKYEFDISKKSMQALIAAKDIILERLKKSTLTQLESANSTESNLEQDVTS